MASTSSTNLYDAASDFKLLTANIEGISDDRTDEAIYEKFIGYRFRCHGRAMVLPSEKIELGREWLKSKLGSR